MTHLFIVQQAATNPFTPVLSALKNFVHNVMPRDELDAVKEIQAWSVESSCFTEIPKFAIGRSSTTYKTPHPLGTEAPHYFALTRNGCLATMLPNQVLDTVKFFLEWLSISSSDQLQFDKKLSDVNARYTRILCYVLDKAIEASNIMWDFGIMNEAWSCWQLRTVMAYWNATGFLDASVWQTISQGDHWLNLPRATGEFYFLAMIDGFINPSQLQGACFMPL